MVLPTWSPRHCGLRVRADPARALSTVGRSHAENVSTFPSQEAFARCHISLTHRSRGLPRTLPSLVRLAEVSMDSCFRGESMLTAPSPCASTVATVTPSSITSCGAACGCLAFHRCVCSCVCVCVCRAHASVHIWEGCRRSTAGRDSKTTI